MEFMHTHGALQGLIAAHIDAHQTEGVDWPASAQFCVVARYKTWPCDWGGKNIRFFSTIDDLECWTTSTRDWARYEDNCVEYSVYEWDWGPTLRAERSFYG